MMTERKPTLGKCEEPVALYGVAYGDLYEPCAKPVGHPGGHDPSDDERRAFMNPCLCCGVDDNEVPHEDTDEHRDTSEHQWTVYNS